MAPSGRSNRGGTTGSSQSRNNPVPAEFHKYQKIADVTKTLVSNGLLKLVGIVAITAMICGTVCLWMVINGNESNISILSNTLLKATEKTWINLALAFTNLMSGGAAIYWKRALNKSSQTAETPEQSP